MFEMDVAKQNIIPCDLSPERYISGMAALNLPAPEGTSGDWHFLNLFYNNKPREVFIAGEKGVVDTRHIYGTYGVYECSNALRSRGLHSSSTNPSYAANHFRAILDLIYYYLLRHMDLSHLYDAASDFLDTEDQKTELLFMASKMLQELDPQQQVLLNQWIYREEGGGKYDV